MLANPDNKNTSIHKYDKEWFLTFMLSLWLFVTRSSNIFYLKVISHIPCYLLIITTIIYNRRNSKKIFPTNILACLVNNSSYVTSVYIGVISDIKCHFHHLHLEQLFIQQKQENNYAIYVSISVPLLKLIYLCWEMRKTQHLMLSIPDNNKTFIVNYDQEWLPTTMLALWLLVIYL